MQTATPIEPTAASPSPHPAPTSKMNSPASQSKRPSHPPSGAALSPPPGGGGGARAVLSLRSRPYRTMMRAHFRLLGPARQAAGERGEGIKALERRVAVRVFDALRRSGKAEGRGEGRPARFYRIARWDKSKREERVEDGWALGKIHKDIIRRMESHRSWMGRGDETADGPLLAVSREEFEELKKDVGVETATNDSPLSTDDCGGDEELQGGFRAKMGTNASATLTKNDHGENQGNDAANNENASPNKNASVSIAPKVEPKKSIARNAEPKKHLIPHKTKSNSKLVERQAAFPLQAKLVQTSKIVKVRVTLSQARTSPPDAAEFAARKSTPARAAPGENPSPETPAIPRKKLVTPATAAASTDGRRRRSAPDDAAESATRAASSREERRAGATGAADSFEERSRRGARFEQRKNAPFPEIVHAMVCNATATVPDVLRWNEDGDRFVVENAEEMGSILERYFRTSNNSSFVRQLNLYGWKKLKTDGSFYHPLFRRDMDMEEEVLSRFVRGGSIGVLNLSPVPDQSVEAMDKKGARYRATSSRSTPMNPRKEKSEEYGLYRPTCASDRSSVKRAAFRTACSGIKSTFETDEAKWEGSGAEDDVDMEVDHDTVVLVSSSAKNNAPSEQNETLPYEPDEPPKKRGPGRPRRHQKPNEGVTKVSPELAVAVPFNETFHSNPMPEEFAASFAGVTIAHVEEKMPRGEVMTAPPEQQPQKRNNETFHSNPMPEEFAASLAGVTIAHVEEKMPQWEVTTAPPEQQPQKRKRGRPKKNKPVFKEVQSVSENLISRKPRKCPKPTPEATTVSPVLQSVGYHVSYAYAHNEAILAEAEYDTYWLGRNFNPQPSNVPSSNGLVRAAEPLEVPSMWAQNHAIAPTSIDKSHNQFSSKRLSFMPTTNAELQTNYFSPIRPHSFSRPSDESAALLPQTNPAPTKMNYSTPMKDQSDAPLIEFSWRSSASYSYENNTIAGLPSIDIDVDGLVTGSTCDGDASLIA